MKGIGSRMSVRVVRRRTEESKGWGDFASVVTLGCCLDYGICIAREYLNIGVWD